MESRLASAVRTERFRDAARLRDQIESLRLTDEYVRLEVALRAAVADERYLEACVLRDDLAKLAPPPVVGWGVGGPAAAADADASGADRPTSSVAETAGILVRVECWHMPEHDEGSAGRAGEALVRYTFGYKVMITNGSAGTVQLVGRHWIIENSSGPEGEVKGPGVVGRQPVLDAGESFEYTSACPLTCKVVPGCRIVGSMRGEFSFCRGSTGTDQFAVDAAPVYFVLPGPP